MSDPSQRQPIRIQALPGMYQPPSVAAVLLFTDTTLWRFARVSATSFAAQAYQRKHVVVINATQPVQAPTRVLTKDETEAVRGGKTVEELGVPTRLRQVTVVPPGGLLGVTEVLVDVAAGAVDFSTLYKRALTLVDADYVCQIATEEVTHPFRLAFQTMFLGGKPVALRYQGLFSLRSARALAREWYDGQGYPPGVPGTSLVPRRLIDAGDYNFDDISVVPDMPAARVLSTCLLTTGTTQDEEDFFGPKERQHALRRDEATYLHAMLADFQLITPKAQTQPPTDTPS